MTKEYMPRLCDNTLKDRLASKGAVLIEGPKWCGKTTTAEQLASSVLYLQDPKMRMQNLRLAELDPALLLEGTTPRLIDEWQDAPSLWDAVRFEVDKRDEFGQFLLTGSTVPPQMEELAHSGTGRIARMKMRTMSLFESNDSLGSVSLADLFEGKQETASSIKQNINSLAYLVCRGGWPKAVHQPEEIALQQAYDYFDAICEVDISKVDSTKRNPIATQYLLRSYARMSSSQCSYETIRQDMNSSGFTLSEPAFQQYIQALNKLFVLEDLPAWNPNLRSKTAIRTSPTRHFIDPSIAAAALGATPQKLVQDLNTFGLLFESLCVRDLRIYAESIGGTVSHYRDKSGLESDAVVSLRDGRYGLIEIKLGGETLIDEGATSLKTLANKIDTTKMPQPSFLMVLTGTGDYAYPREDGVYVAPIPSLKS